MKINRRRCFQLRNHRPSRRADYPKGRADIVRLQAAPTEGATRRRCFQLRKCRPSRRADYPKGCATDVRLQAAPTEGATRRRCFQLRKCRPSRRADYPKGRAPPTCGCKPHLRRGQPVGAASSCASVDLLIVPITRRDAPSTCGCKPHLQSRSEAVAKPKKRKAKNRRPRTRRISTDRHALRGRSRRAGRAAARWHWRGDWHGPDRRTGRSARSGGINGRHNDWRRDRVPAQPRL